MTESASSPTPDDQITGDDFTLAFRTLLARGIIGSGHKIHAWATHAQVDPRSLNRFVKEGRSVRCGYALRLCTALGLSLSDLIRQAIELAYRTGPGGRPVLKGLAQKDKQVPLRDASRSQSNRFTKVLSGCLVAAVRESGLSLAAISRASGLSRPTLSRLAQARRDDHTLAYLFDLTRAIGCQLDALVMETEA